VRSRPPRPLTAAADASCAAALGRAAAGGRPPARPSVHRLGGRLTRAEPSFAETSFSAGRPADEPANQQPDGAGESLRQVRPRTHIQTRGRRDGL